MHPEREKSANVCEIYKDALCRNSVEIQRRDDRMADIVTTMTDPVNSLRKGGDIFPFIVYLRFATTSQVHAPWLFDVGLRPSQSDICVVGRTTNPLWRIGSVVKRINDGDTITFLLRFDSPLAIDSRRPRSARRINRPLYPSVANATHKKSERACISPGKYKTNIYIYILWQKL